MKTSVIPKTRINQSVYRFIKSNHLRFMVLVALSFGMVAMMELSAGNIRQVSTGDSIFHVVDKRPVFKGKPSDVHKFIKNQMVYPEDAWIKGIEGVVQVSFVVTSKGTVLNTKIEKSVSPELDMEALRLVDLLNNWKPGMKNGVAVHTYVSIPIEFSLSKEERDFVSTLQKYGLSENPPMYVIDNKIVNSRIHLPSYNLESIRVLKGDKAVERYGEKARNGVVIMTTKRGTPPVW